MVITQGERPKSAGSAAGRTIGLLLVAGLLVSQAAVAGAHSVADYPAYGWKYTILTRVFYQAPNAWPDRFNAPTSAMMDDWNAIGSMNLVRSLAGNASTGTWSCGTSFDLVRTDNNMPAGIGMTTTLCNDLNSTVRIRVNTGDYTWYTGSSTPNPQGEADFRGSIKHELGHALQAWGVCTSFPTDVDPCPGGHFDPANDPARCDLSDMLSYHTMCYSIPEASTWRQRTLETHDIDLAQAMY